MKLFSFHRATLEDLSILIDMRVEFLSEFWGQQDSAIVLALRVGLKKYFHEALSNNTYISWYVKSGDAIAGIGGMAIIIKPGSFRVPDGKCGYIMSMYTRPEFRKKGIAAAILEKLVLSGKEEGIKFFELHATKDGEPVYEKGGFSLHTEPTYRKLVLD
jgi:GNAT superfamily N-acetyltransferase